MEVEVEAYGKGGSTVVLGLVLVVVGVEMNAFEWKFLSSEDFLKRDFLSCEREVEE